MYISHKHVNGYLKFLMKFELSPENLSSPFPLTFSPSFIYIYIYIYYISASFYIFRPPHIAVYTPHCTGGNTGQTTPVRVMDDPAASLTFVPVNPINLVHEAIFHGFSLPPPALAPAVHSFCIRIPLATPCAAASSHKFQWNFLICPISFARLSIPAILRDPSFSAMPVLVNRVYAHTHVINRPFICTLNSRVYGSKNLTVPVNKLLYETRIRGRTMNV